MLAPYLDEIELLLFESSPNSLPSKHQIKTLSTLASEFDISYNIHMPIDISLGDLDPNRRHYAIDTIKRVVDLARPLSPSTHTLHLSYNEASAERERFNKWQDAICKSMEHLMLTGIDSASISIENLMYPLEWVGKIITSFNLSVCLDLGHLILQKADIGSVFDKYAAITPVIHLYGVAGHHEHLSLETLSKKDMASVFKILKRFSGVVSLEVFSYRHLRTSLDVLERCWFDRLG